MEQLGISRQIWQEQICGAWDYPRINQWTHPAEYGQTLWFVALLEDGKHEPSNWAVRDTITVAGYSYGH